jgi:hypothetical protein
MIQTLLTAAVVSSLFLSTSVTPIPPAKQHIGFTHVLPVQQYVSLMLSESDSLEHISMKYYGSGDYWKNLWNDNAWITDPDHVEKDARLRIYAYIPQSVAELSEDLIERNRVLNEEKNKAYLASIRYVSPDSVVEPTVVPATPSVVSSNFDSVYKDAGARYGIPWQILYGLHKTESGCRDGAVVSGNGPQGPMQFMPGTWNSYAIDGNGDGVSDINNATDAIYTAANFLAKHGSVDAGLRSYGGNNAGVLSIARSNGYIQ